MEDLDCRIVKAKGAKWDLERGDGGIPLEESPVESSRLGIEFSVIKVPLIVEAAHDDVRLRIQAHLQSFGGTGCGNHNMIWEVCWPGRIR